MSGRLYFDKTLEKLGLLTRCTGTNIEIGKERPTKTVKNRLIYIFNMIWLNIDVFGALSFVIIGMINGGNFTELTYGAPCVTLSFLANTKSFFIIFYEKEVYELINRVKVMEDEENSRCKTPERRQIIDKGVNFLNLVVNVLYVLNITLLVMFAVHPLTLMGLKYMNTNEVELLLPFLVVYPFDAYNIKIWPIIYVRQIWSEILVVFNICIADFMLYNFCSYITIQFRLLQYDIENLIETNPMDTIVPDQSVQAKLVEIIKWHQELICCVHLLETVYAKSTLYNFISSSVIICLTGFNVTENKDVALILTFLTFLLMGLMQIFFLCFFGDMLMDASFEVCDAVYNSKWYLATLRTRKSLLLIQTRSLEPCRLTAFGFADVSLSAFMKVLSTSWSYFALLKTLYSSE